MRSQWGGVKFYDVKAYEDNEPPQKILNDYSGYYKFAEISKSDYDEIEKTLNPTTL